MNIKVVYENKIHKLPQTLKDYQKIRQTIKQIYGDALGEDFDIYTKVHPSQNQKKYLDYDPIIIKDQTHFNNLQKNFGGLQITLKFLVKNKSDQQFSSEEMNMLNQSLVQVFPINKIFEIDEQVIPPKQPKDNKDQICAKSRQMSKQNIDYEKLKSVIVDIIDERLKHYGLIYAPIIPEYRMSIQKLQAQCEAEPRKSVLWSVQIKNIGNVTWYKAEVYLECIEGQFIGEQIFLNEDIPADETCSFGSKLIAPLMNFSKPNVFKLFHDGKPFGKDITFCFRLPFNQYLLTPQDYEKVEMLMDKTGLSEKEAVEFFHYYRKKNLNVGQLINEYNQQIL